MTCLSTVGYGDYTPVSDAEMIVTVCFQVIGIIVFSFAMGTLSDMLTGGQSNNRSELI